MLKKPIFEKFISEKNVEVLVVEGFRFCINHISHKQAQFLNEFVDYFYSNPTEFLPYLKELISNYEVVEVFLAKKNPLLDDRDKHYILVNIICREVLGIRTKSFDYIVYNAVKEITENRNALVTFISTLIGFGYKKSEIDKFSNVEIIRLALEEIYYRDVFEFCDFVGGLVSRTNLTMSSRLKEIISEFLRKNNVDESTITEIENKFAKTKQEVKKQSQPYQLVKDDAKDMFDKIPE